MHPKKIVKIVFCILLLQTMMPSITPLNGQVQSHQSTVIDFLSRMAQKGKIEFNDFIKPVDRKIIFQKLMIYIIIPNYIKFLEKTLI